MTKPNPSCNFQEIWREAVHPGDGKYVCSTEQLVKKANMSLLAD